MAMRPGRFDGDEVFNDMSTASSCGKALPKSAKLAKSSVVVVGLVVAVGLVVVLLALVVLAGGDDAFTTSLRRGDLGEVKGFCR